MAASTFNDGSLVHQQFWLPDTVERIMLFAVDSDNATMIQSLHRRFRDVPRRVGLKQYWSWRVIAPRRIVSDVKVPWRGAIDVSFENTFAGMTLNFTSASGYCSREHASISLLVVDPDDDDYCNMPGILCSSWPLGGDREILALGIPEDFVGQLESSMSFRLTWDLSPREIRLKVAEHDVCHVISDGWVLPVSHDREAFLSIRSLPNAGMERWNYRPVLY